jgi:hypothetical protein
MLSFKNNAAALVLGFSLLFEGTARALTAPTRDEPKPSQQECVEVLTRLARVKPLDAAQLESAQALMQRCKEVLRVRPDPKAPLPTATECSSGNVIAFPPTSDRGLLSAASLQALDPR